MLWAHVKIKIILTKFTKRFSHSLLPFLQNKFFEPRKVSWVFDLVLDNFCINELPMLKMQGIQHVCFYKRILLSSLVIPFFDANGLAANLFEGDKKFIGRYENIALE